MERLIPEINIESEAGTPSGMAAGGREIRSAPNEEKYFSRTSHTRRDKSLHFFLCWFYVFSLQEI